MRRATLQLALFGLLLCSCGRSPEDKPVRVGEDPTWISKDRTREVGMHVLLNRYPQAQIVSESGQGQIYTYRFATNGTVCPLAVVVDRKAGKGRFEKLTRIPK